MIHHTHVIAVEEHFAPAEYLRAAHDLEVWPGDADEMALMRGLERTPKMYPQVTDLTARIAEMDTHGIDRMVLSLNPPGVQPYEAAAATAMAREFNDSLGKVVREWPTRFGGLGTVAPQDPRQAAEETARIMGPLGLGGIMINSHTQGHYLDEPAYDPLLEAAAAEGATIYLHPRAPSPQMLAPYRDYGMMFALWGYQAEAGTHAVRLILSGAFDRHPDLKVVLGHLGEGLPFWAQRMDNRYAWAYANIGESMHMTKLELTPGEYLRRNFTLTTSGMDDPAVLAFCLGSVGEDNIMFAVDTPYEDSGPATQFLGAADLTDVQRAKISHLTAERLFRLPPAPVP